MHLKINDKKIVFVEKGDIVLDNKFIVIKEAIPPVWDFGNVLFIRK